MPSSARRPSTSLRSDLAVCGVTIDEGPQPWPRSAAVGHLLVAGTGAALPIVANSKYRVRDGHLLLDGTDLGLDVAPVERPGFHRLSTADGTPYYLLANRHGADVLTIGVTASRSVPAAVFAQLAVDAVRLDGVRSVIITSDAAERSLADVVAAVAGAVPALPIQVQLPVARPLTILAELKLAGAGSVALLAQTGVGESVWREAVRLFGRNQVSTYVVVDTHTDADVAVEWAGELIRLGVYPLVVAFRPGPGTLPADGGRVRTLPSWLVADVSDRVAELLAAAGMRGVDQAAGCAACGACSCLASAGG